MDVSLQNGTIYAFKERRIKKFKGANLSVLVEKVILAILLSIFLLYPVYKFIFTLSARRYSLDKFEIVKEKIKRRSIFYSLCITIIFSLFIVFKSFKMKLNFNLLKIIAIAFGIFTFCWMIYDFIYYNKSINKNYIKANEAFLEKDFKQSLQYYELALEQDPENIFFLEGKG